MSQKQKSDQANMSNLYPKQRVILEKLISFTLTLQEIRSIHDSMNIPAVEFIVYIYILL